MQGAAHRLTGRLFSCMHARRQRFGEALSCLAAAIAWQRHRCSETDGCSTERTRRRLPVANPHWDHRNLNAASLRQLRQSNQSLVELDRSILPLNPSLGKHHQLLAIGQQIDGESQRGHGGPPLIHWEATKAL